MIRLAVPDIDNLDIEAVAEALRSGWLVQGARVREFEVNVARYVGAPYAVAVNSGTSALHLSLLALDVGSSDTVAVPAYSWPATANAVRLCGAEPVFVDIDPVSFAMDPDQLKETIDATPTLKAVVPVHAFGEMAPIERIAELAGRAGLPIVEDAACALGSRSGGRCAGTYGAVGCFSFHPRKAITTGEGGILVTADSHVDQRVRALRNHGLNPQSGEFEFIDAGFNYRMTEFQASLGSSQLKRVDQIIQKRREIAARYDDLLRGKGVTIPRRRSDESHVYQSYVVIVPKDVDRDRVIARMKSKGVESGVGTVDIPRTVYYSRRRTWDQEAFPVASDIATRSLSLPIHTQLQPSDQETVVRELLNAMW